MKLMLKFYGIPRQPQLVEHVRYCANFEMSRFARRLLRLDVTLAYESRPGLGIDKTCLITARLRDLAPVVVSTADATERDAVDRAFHRLRRAVARALEQGRETPRCASLVARVTSGKVERGD